MRLGDDLAGFLKRLSAGLGEILGKIGLHAANAAVTDGQPRPGYLLHEFPKILACLDHVEKDRKGPQLHRAAPTQVRWSLIREISAAMTRT